MDRSISPPSERAAVGSLGLLVAAVLLAACSSPEPGPVPDPERVTAAELHEAVRSSEGEMIVVNVWATWCAPCEDEFPEYVRFARAYRREGVRMMFVSVDRAGRMDEVKAFLREQGVDWKTYVKEGSAHRFITALHGNWSGALPTTFVFRPDGTLETYWEGKGSYSQLERQAERLL